ncbi:hypothetical protein MKX01_008115 [Papaver californicum]|nr:hypothetical protein MKX01_008115 [Papaver californicum]
MITTEDDETLNRVFSQLKPFCLQLVQFLQNPKNITSTKAATASVSQIHGFLSQSPPHTLQPFLNYVLFSLLLLLDGAVASRSSQEGKSGPHPVNDSMSEGVLKCPEEILRKCHLGSLNQMIVVLKKLTSGALLTPPESSEEFREGIVRCFRALLLRLHACSNASCICKEIPSLPAFAESSILQTPLDSKSEPDECLLAFLQSQDASAAVGHWLSFLLKVGTSDALAFFLPGVVSQFAKILHVSKAMISGAAASTEAIDQTVRGLAEFLTIVLKDEANLSGLGEPVNDISSPQPSKSKSSQVFLEALRHLPNTALEANSSRQITYVRSLCVSRTKDWIEQTSVHVDKLLSATFPHLCVHPSEKVRRGLVAAIGGLLSKCSFTMKTSWLMLLECLFVLVCDDSDEVSVVAQESIECFLMLGEKELIEGEIAEIINRIIEKLPKVVLGSEEPIALSNAHRLLAVMYYAGPQLLVDHFLRSPATAARFLDVLTICLSQNSVFAGSLDKLITAKPLSAGYLHSITELKPGSRLNSSNCIGNYEASSKVSEILNIREEASQSSHGIRSQDYEIPRMPPWFFRVGSRKLYQTLAGVLRLVGLSTMADSRSEVSLSNNIDIPLNCLRKLVSEVRMKRYYKESWQSWYTRCASGQVLRQASTAACILNEIIYGMSDQSIGEFSRMFHKSKLRHEEQRSIGQSNEVGNAVIGKAVWKVSEEKRRSGHIIDCVGSIIHEYLSTEVWDLPIDQKVPLQELDSEAEGITLHFIHDTTMLHQESASSINF